MKKDYSSYSKYSSGSPHKTVSYAKYEDKSPTRTDSSAFSKYSTTSSPFSTSRFLKKEQTSTEKLESPASNDGRYHYRTRPQPVLKKLDIPTASSTSRPESSTHLTPTSPTASKTFSPEKPSTPVSKSAPEYPVVKKYISVTTRATSPTPPSTYYRSRRSDVAREIIKDILKPPEVDSKEKETQTDSKIEDSVTSRYSRYSRTSTPWTSSLVDKYASPSSSYSSPISRYMSKLTTDSPKSTLSRYSSRFENDSSSRSTSADTKNTASPVVATIRQTAVPQSASYSSERKQRSPSKERVVFSPRPSRKLSNVSIEKDLTSSNASSYIPSRRNSVKSKSPIKQIFASRASSPNNSSSSIPKIKSPEKTTDYITQKRFSKSPEKIVTRISSSPDKQRIVRKSVSPLKIPAQKSKTPEQLSKSSNENISTIANRDIIQVTPNNTRDLKSSTPESVPCKKLVSDSPKFGRKSISPEKVLVRRTSHSPEKVLLRPTSISPEKQIYRRKSLSKTPEPLVTQKPPVSKSPSPEKRIKSASPEKVPSIIKTNSNTSIRSIESNQQVFSSNQQSKSKSVEKIISIQTTESGKSISSSNSSSKISVIDSINSSDANEPVKKPKKKIISRKNSTLSTGSTNSSGTNLISAERIGIKSSIESDESSNSKLDSSCNQQLSLIDSELIRALDQSAKIIPVDTPEGSYSEDAIPAVKKPKKKIISRKNSSKGTLSANSSDIIRTPPKQSASKNSIESEEQLSTSKDQQNENGSKMLDGKKTNSLDSEDSKSKEKSDAPETAKKPRRKIISRKNSTKSTESTNSSENNLVATKRPIKNMSIESEATAMLTQDSSKIQPLQQNDSELLLDSLQEKRKPLIAQEHNYTMASNTQGDVPEPVEISGGGLISQKNSAQSIASMQGTDQDLLSPKNSSSKSSLESEETSDSSKNLKLSGSELLKDVEKVIKTVPADSQEYDSSESNIVIENLKSVLEDLKTGLLRDHVIEAPSHAENGSRSEQKVCENLSYEQNNNFIPIMVEEFITQPLEDESFEKQLNIDLPSSPLELSPPTNKKPPLSPSKSDVKVSDGKIKLCTSAQKHLKPSSSLNALVKPKNKDFRKSPLNMSNATHDESEKALSEGNSPIEKRKIVNSNLLISKCETSSSVARLSDNKLVKNKALSALTGSQQSSFDESFSLSLSSKLDQAGGSTNDMSVESLSPRQLSDSKIDQTNEGSRPDSRTQFIRHSKSSRHDSSSTESSSEESESEESDDKEQDKGISKMVRASFDSPQDSPVLPIRSRSISQLKVISRDASGTSEDPSVSLPLDKPPLPPNVKSKEDSPNKAASYLMRALAPVTSLFFSKSKEEKSINTSDCDKMDTSQSLSELPLDKSGDHLDSESYGLFSEEITESPQLRDDRYSTLPVRKRPESQDIDWWLDENERQTRANKIEDASSVEPMSIAEPDETQATNIKAEEIGEENVVKPMEIKSDRVGHGAKRKIRPFSSGDNPLMSRKNGSHEESPQSPKQCSEPSLDNVKRKIFRSSSGINTLSWCLDITGDLSESEESESESESSEETEDDSKPTDVVLGTKKIQIKRIESGEKAWWQQSNANIPDGIARIESKTSVSDQSCPQVTEDTPWWMQSESEKDTTETSAALVSEDPVAQVYRIRTQQSGDKARWMQSTENVPMSLQVSGSSNSISRQSSGRKSSNRKYKIRHAESGEKAWWMQSSENIPEGIKRTPSSASSKSVQRNASLRAVTGTDDNCKIQRIESGDKSRWLQSPDNLPGGVTRTDSRTSSKGLMRNESGRSIAGSEKKYKIRHIESGETAWWMKSSENIPDGIKRTESIRSHTGSLKRNESNRSLQRNRLLKTESGEISSIDNPSEGVKRSESIRSRLRNIKRVESGERAWWMEDNEENVPEGITRLPPDETIEEQEDTDEESDEEDAEEVFINEPETKTRWLRPAESGEMAWWMNKSADVPAGIEQLTPSESEESEEEDSDLESGESPVDQPMIPKFPLVLGDRTSPDGLEMPNLAGRRFTLGGRESPYENVEWLGEKMFIGDTTNIDDLLGDIDPPVPATAEESKSEELPVTGVEKVAKGTNLMLTKFLYFIHLLFLQIISQWLKRFEFTICV